MQCVVCATTVYKAAQGDDERDETASSTYTVASKPFQAEMAVPSVDRLSKAPLLSPFLPLGQKKVLSSNILAGISSV